jgi:hypothetical protein
MVDTLETPEERDDITLKEPNDRGECRTAYMLSQWLILYNSLRGVMILFQRDLRTTESDGLRTCSLTGSALTIA